MTVTLPPSFGPLRRVEETGSTNADLLADTAGAEGEVLVTAHQTAGRGRFDRVWEEVPGSSLLFSVRLRPTFPAAARSWLLPLAGLAVAEAAGSRVDGVSVKWPNDVMVGEAKLAGILAQSDARSVVIGVGCNVAQTADQLPVATATSLALAGATDLDVDSLLTDVLAGLARGYEALTAAGGDPRSAGLLEAYTRRSSTLGSRVAVVLTEGRVEGTATGLSPTGALLVDTGDGVREFSAGDVEHLR